MEGQDIPEKTALICLFKKIMKAKQNTGESLKSPMKTKEKVQTPIKKSEGSKFKTAGQTS